MTEADTLTDHCCCNAHNRSIFCPPTPPLYIPTAGGFICSECPEFMASFLIAQSAGRCCRKVNSVNLLMRFCRFVSSWQHQSKSRPYKAATALAYRYSFPRNSVEWFHFRSSLQLHISPLSSFSWVFISRPLKCRFVFSRHQYACTYGSA